MSSPFCTVSSSSSDRTARLLFFNGTIERPNKSKPPPRTISLQEIHRACNNRFSGSASPSPSVESRYSCRNVVSTVEEKLRKGEEDHRKELQEESELESESESSILHSFAALAQGILSVWEGEGSVRGRIDLLVKRQQAMKGDIEMIEKTQSDLRGRLQILEQQAEEESTFLEKIREDRINFIRANKSAITTLQSDMVSTDRHHSWQPATAEEEEHNRSSYDRGKLDDGNVVIRDDRQAYLESYDGQKYEEQYVAEPNSYQKLQMKPDNCNLAITNHPKVVPPTYGSKKLDDYNLDDQKDHSHSKSHSRLNLEEQYIAQTAEQSPNPNTKSYDRQNLEGQYVAERHSNLSPRWCYGRQKVEEHYEAERNSNSSPRWSYGKQEVEEQYEAKRNSNPNPRWSYGRQKVEEQYEAERNSNLGLSYVISDSSNLNCRSSPCVPDRSNSRSQQEWQMAAFEILELVHKKLTAQMWTQMVQKLRGMESDKRRGEYLELFRGDGTPFAGKPLSEATYGELLSFSIAEDKERTASFYIDENSKEQRLRAGREVPPEETMAIKAAERRGLFSEGFDAKEEKERIVMQKERIRAGINEAMEAAELGFIDELRSKGYDCNVMDSMGVMEVRQQMEIYVRCHRQMKHLAGRHHQMRLDFLREDTINAEKLGILQPASRLIKLGCFFLQHGSPKSFNPKS